MLNVSVITATYNVEAYFAKTAQSALTQTFSDFALIIMDDASTDKTPVVVFSTGGIPDIIDHKINEYLATLTTQKI